MTSKITLPAAVLFLLPLLASCGKNEPQGMPPTAVSVAEVIAREVTPWEEFSGRIEAKEVVQIRPRVGGVIEEVLYHEGDIVKQGDPLFLLDQKPFRTQLNRAEAELARARAQAELAQLESRRARNLVKQKLLSQNDYDQRLAAANQANSNVRAAEATAKLARLNLQYTEIKSPIDGRTGRALVTKGNLVASDPTPELLTTVLSLDPMYVMFDSDEQTYLEYFLNSQRDTEQSAVKRTVYVGLGNEEGFPRQGVVDFVDNRVAQDTGTIRMRAVLENKNYQLTPGLFARVKLLAAQPVLAILINDQAVITDQDRKYVYVLGKENHAERRDIKLGSTIDKLRIVKSGLKPGDKVIVYGTQKIFFPNMPVAPQEIAMTDPPPSPATGKQGAGGH